MKKVFSLFGTNPDTNEDIVLSIVKEGSYYYIDYEDPEYVPEDCPEDAGAPQVAFGCIEDVIEFFDISMYIDRAEREMQMFNAPSECFSKGALREIEARLEAVLEKAFDPRDTVSIH